MMIVTIGHQRALTQYLSRLAFVPGMKILDAGCGSGAATKAVITAMKKQGVTHATLHGFDFTDAAVQDFNTFAARQHSFVMQGCVSDALLVNETLPRDWREYDLVLSSGMLEYLSQDDLIHTLSLLRERIKPDGRLIVFISRPSLFNQFFLERVWRAHCHSSSELHRIFHSANLHIISLVPFQSWGYAIEATP